MMRARRDPPNADVVSAVFAQLEDLDTPREQITVLRYCLASIEHDLLKGSRRDLARKTTPGRDPLRSAKRFYIEHSRHGYSAILLDAKGRSVNVINGSHEPESKVRAAAIKHWPGAREIGHPLRSATRARKPAKKRVRR